jgi:hypothetical protein
LVLVSAPAWCWQAYVSDSPAAASSLRTLSQRRSREERRQDRRDCREALPLAAADAVLLPAPKESAKLTVAAEYNAVTNAVTKAKASGPFKYCVGVAGRQICALLVTHSVLYAMC